MVQSFFVAYAAALLSLSPEKIAGFYQTPMAVYSDEGVITVGKMPEVVDFWKKGIKPYEKMNISRAVPNVLSEEQLSKTITVCKVLWTNFDKEGKEVGRETNFYTLSKKDGDYRISGLIIMGQ